MTLAEALTDIAKDYRSHKEASEVLGVDKAYWYRLLSGENSNPSPETLAKIGLKETRSYERVPPALPCGD